MSASAIRPFARPPVNHALPSRTPSRTGEAEMRQPVLDGLFAHECASKLDGREWHREPDHPSGCTGLGLAIPNLAGAEYAAPASFVGGGSRS